MVVLVTVHDQKRAYTELQQLCRTRGGKGLCGAVVGEGEPLVHDVRAAEPYGGASVGLAAQRDADRPGTTDRLTTFPFI